MPKPQAPPVPKTQAKAQAPPKAKARAGPDDPWDDTDDPWAKSMDPWAKAGPVDPWAAAAAKGHGKGSQGKGSKPSVAAKSWSGQYAPPESTITYDKMELLSMRGTMLDRRIIGPGAPVHSAVANIRTLRIPTMEVASDRRARRSDRDGDRSKSRENKDRGRRREAAAAAAAAAEGGRSGTPHRDRQAHTAESA